MVAKKESSFYSEMQKISEELAKRKTLTPQLIREYELSQYGFSSTSGFSQLINAQKKESKKMEELEKKIKQQSMKVEKLNKFSEHMHFMDDQEIVEMYEVIHNEEKILNRMKEQLACLKKEKEDKEESCKQ